MQGHLPPEINEVAFVATDNLDDEETESKMRTFLKKVAIVKKLSA
jgi:hypothetical protein